LQGGGTRKGKKKRGNGRDGEKKPVCPRKRVKRLEGGRDRAGKKEKKMKLGGPKRKGKKRPPVYKKEAGPVPPCPRKRECVLRRENKGERERGWASEREKLS